LDFFFYTISWIPFTRWLWQASEKDIQQELIGDLHASGILRMSDTKTFLSGTNIRRLIMFFDEVDQTSLNNDQKINLAKQIELIDLDSKQSDENFVTYIHLFSPYPLDTSELKAAETKTRSSKSNIEPLVWDRITLEKLLQFLWSHHPQYGNTTFLSLFDQEGATEFWALIQGKDNTPRVAICVAKLVYNHAQKFGLFQKQGNPFTGPVVAAASNTGRDKDGNVKNCYTLNYDYL